TGPVRPWRERPAPCGRARGRSEEDHEPEAPCRGDGGSRVEERAGDVRIRASRAGELEGDAVQHAAPGDQQNDAGDPTPERRGGQPTLAALARAQVAAQAAEEP